MNDDQTSIQAWRDTMDQRLRDPNGILSVVGLAWLNEGENTVGSDENNTVQLPDVPAQLGTLTLKDGDVYFAPNNADVLINQQPASPQHLKPDTNPDSMDVVQSGSISFFVIKRGERVGLRIKDSTAPSRSAIQARQWFPLDQRYHLEATFTPYDFPKPIEITNVLGDTVVEASVGFVTFELDGVHELVVVSREADELFFVFRDASTPQKTYPIRFLTANIHDDISVDLDFNRAYNPPCSFSPHFTCPMPPHENILPIEILAGEQYQHQD